MESKPKVSVVIPAYNAAPLIEKALESVRAQTYKDYEIVVVDDGSPDDTHAVVVAWLDRTGTPGRCVVQPNKKIAGARNTGMREARGEYIALLDHDDFWYPEKLSTVMEEFSRHPSADLICHRENITREGKVLSVTKIETDAPGLYERLLFDGNALSPSASVFKKSKALEIGGFRENPEFNTVEDYDFWMRLSRVARFHFLNKVLGEYKLVDDSATSKVQYHHANTEHVLRDHFRQYFGDRPGWRGELKMRRRLSAVYRSALWQLVRGGASPEDQRDYAARMLREFPLDPKNICRAAQWWFRR